MKWFLANKFTPIDNNRLFIRAIYIGNIADIHDRASDIYTGHYDHDQDEWVINGVYALHKQHYTVTHFCIAGPIEDEE